MSNDRRNGRPQQGNYASSSNNDNDGRFFVMQHMMSVVTQDASTKDVWYVNSGASNHMTYHQNWFNKMKEPNKLGYVETGDDTMHPIEHVGNVPLSMHDGKEKYMADVLHVPTITKNLVSFGQMVEQGLQVRFNEHGCFVEDFKDKCRLVAKGNRVGRMFTLNVNMPRKGMAMYAQGARVIADVDIWHKRIGHVNPQRLKSMQTQGIVTWLPNFKVVDMQKVCEACQFGKQSRHAFSKERNVSEYCMKAKSEVFEHFKHFKMMVEKETGMHIKCLRSDGGGEYFSNEFSKFLYE